MDGIDYILSYQDMTQNDTRDGLEKSFDIVYENKSKIPAKWHHGGPCIPSIRKLFVDVKGTFYPCEKIVEHACFSIGNLEKGLDLNKIIEILNIGKLTEEECKGCWAFRFCDICVAGCDDIFEGTISAKQKKKSCDNVKKRALGSLKNYVGRKVL